MVKKNPNLNHCICLNDTSTIVDHQIIECYDHEKECFMCLEQINNKKKDPDIIIGYNILGLIIHLCLNARIKPIVWLNL